MADIVFLHTSPAHVPTFDGLLAELAPHLRALHVVRDDLLARAQRDGLHDAGLSAAWQAALDDAAAQARVVVCTCSTLGGLAEAASASSPVPVMRIDRAMADQAVQRGAPVLVVATVSSTLQPTAQLMQSSADTLGVPLVMRTVCLPKAWTLFEAVQHAAYIDAVVDGVRDAAAPGDTVVLAQASMAPAAERLSAAGLTVLASPRLGVARAVSVVAG